MAETEDLDYLCRLCATKMSIIMGQPIFEENDDMKNVYKKITACFPVQVCQS